jgi:hypothetical protein
MRANDTVFTAAYQGPGYPPRWYCCHDQHGYDMFAAPSAAIGPVHHDEVLPYYDLLNRLRPAQYVITGMSG